MAMVDERRTKRVQRESARGKMRVALLPTPTGTCFNSSNQSVVELRLETERQKG